MDSCLFALKRNRFSSELSGSKLGNLIVQVRVVLFYLGWMLSSVVFALDEMKMRKTQKFVYLLFFLQSRT